MTEREWDVCDDLSTMLNSLQGAPKTGRRRRLLFGVACCRSVWDTLALEQSRNAVEQAEQFADALRPPQALSRPQQSLGKRILEVGGSIPADHAVHKLLAVEINIGSISQFSIIAAGRDNREELIRQAQIAYLRDIFGNPFRPVAFDPGWRSEVAVSLARTAYDTRNFTLLLILADALEEAGCDHADVLNHCRDPNGVHVRGCWVVDGVLSKQ